MDSQLGGSGVHRIIVLFILHAEENWVGGGGVQYVGKQEGGLNCL